MTLDQYFKKRRSGGGAKTTKVGKATAWMDFCQFRLRGAKFLIVDASFLPSKEDGLLVRATPGEYLLQAQVTAYGSDRRISRLRGLLKGTQGKLGAKLGETWTDTATTAICDFQLFSKAWGADDEISYAKIEKGLEAAENHGIAVLDKDREAVAPFVASGFGDGTFPVYELVQRRRRVGFEIEFIAEGVPYPFGGRAASRPKAEAATVADESSALMSQLFERLGQAFKKGKESSSVSPEQRKTKLTEAFKGIEDELRGKAKQAAAEYRQRIEQVRRKANPPRLNFVPVTDDSMFQAPEAERRVQELKAAGFVSAGVYQTDGTAHSRIAGWVNPELRAYAIINSSTQGIDCDIYAEYSDQTSFCVTENTRNGWMSQPAWKTVVRKSVASMGALLKLFLRKAPKQERLPVSAQEFARRLVPDAERHLDWLNDRGGFSRAELQALARQRNNPRADDNEWLKERRLETSDRALYNWLRVQPGLAFHPETVMNSLSIVHDELTSDLLVFVYWCATGDYKARESDFAPGGSREAFARVNAERGCKLRKVAQKRTGLAADYYLPQA
jgi:hypothetical protein